MVSITLFEGSIGDRVTSLAIAVRRDDEALPIVLDIDSDSLRLSLDHAAQLAKAGRRIEKALKSKEAPQDAVVFQHKIGFANGEVSIFELGTVADPLGVYVIWDKKRIALGLDRCPYLLFVLSRIGEAVDDVRASHSSQPTSPGFTNLGERYLVRNLTDWRGPGWV